MICSRTGVCKTALILATSLLGFRAFAAPTTQPAIPGLSDELLPPVCIEADGKPIDVDVGHAAPYFGDFDRDGVKDLLVGQFGDGKLRVYRNVGTNDKPQFKDFTWFKTGADFGKVPYG